MSSLLSAFDVKEDIIDFSIGAPGPKLLEKARILISSANKTFDQLATAGRKDFQQIFQYGPNCGSPVFINALASFLSSEYQDFVCPESLILTAGATQGLHLIASTQLDKKNGVVFVENPTYFLALDILSKDLGFKIEPMHSADVDNLEALILKHKPANSDVDIEGNQKFWGMVYIIPTFHNPTGTCMKQTEVNNLMNLAEKHGLLTVCDDVYNLLHYHDQGI